VVVTEATPPASPQTPKTPTAGAHDGAAEAPASAPNPTLARAKSPHRLPALSPPKKSPKKTKEPKQKKRAP
jgi:hypothetical protein